MEESASSSLKAVLRIAGEADYGALGEIMFAAVRKGPSQYSEVQRAAWVPEPRWGTAWTERLKSQFIVMAECHGEAIGFMSLAHGGYIDFAYILANYRGQGLFGQLYHQIEREAQRQCLDRLWVHASLNAKSAFESI